MTVQEAIERLKVRLAVCETTDSALNIAIESMEKQVAKKIVIRGQGYEADCLCPNCGICLGIDADYVYEQTKYCNNCGQALAEY